MTQSSVGKLHSEQFLQQQLQEVITLLEKQKLEKSLVHRELTTTDLIETVLHKQQQTRLQDKFAQLHPADIAAILESLPLDQRQIAWEAIKTDHEGHVLLEVSDAVRQTLISGMEAEELASVASQLNTDEIADIAADIPKRAMLKILRSLNGKERSDLNAILAYSENQIGSLMDFGMITIRSDLNLKAVIAYIRKLGKLPSHTDKLFVVDQYDVVQGVLPLQRLLTHRPALQVANVMVTDFVRFQGYQETAEVARAFERYDLISAPIVDEDGKLQGRLCIDSILDFVREKSDEDLLSQAGVDEEEDLFSSVWKSARNRWGWLLINIVTAFASTRIIGVFEDVILPLPGKVPVPEITEPVPISNVVPDETDKMPLLVMLPPAETMPPVFKVNVPVGYMVIVPVIVGVPVIVNAVVMDRLPVNTHAELAVNPPAVCAVHESPPVKLDGLVPVPLDPVYQFVKTVGSTAIADGLE